ncbi:hypothetical protein Tco_0448262 [Tanacetum coccineum]
MTSLDYRLNPLFTIKECSSCGSLYNKGYCCTPDSSQRPPQDCVKCGNPVEGPNCQGCALWRKKLKEVWFTICHENGIYQDLLNTYESSDDDTNVVNAPREPFVVKQDPGKKSSQSPPHIDHNCCYECGDLLDDIFCQQCTYPHSFNAESNLIESLLNRDTSIDSSPKFDYLLEEFSGELAHIDSIPPGIEKADFDLEEEIRHVENLVDSFMEEIDLFLASDDSMPPGIENDDYDSEGDICFLEELLSNDPLPLPEIESSNLDHFNDPSSPRPPPEPPDVEICFDVEPDTTVKNDFDELNEDECFDPGGEIDVFANVEDDDYFPFTFIIRIFLPYLTYPKVSPLLLSTGSEDTIFDPGIST